MSKRRLAALLHLSAVLSAAFGLLLIASPLPAYANPLGLQCEPKIGFLTLSKGYEPAGQYYDVYNLTCEYTYPTPAGEYPGSHRLVYVWVAKYNPHITQNYGCEKTYYDDVESATKKTEVRLTGKYFTSPSYKDTFDAAQSIARGVLVKMEPASLPCDFTPPPSAAPIDNPLPKQSVVAVTSMAPGPTDNGGGVPVAGIVGGVVVVGGGTALVLNGRKPKIPDPGTPATGTGPQPDSPFLTGTPGLISLQGKPAIDELVKRGGKTVPGTTWVLAGPDLPPGIPGSGWQTKQIPNPAKPGETLTVVDPNAVVVLVDTHVPLPPAPPATGATVVPAVPAVAPPAPVVPPPVVNPPVVTPPVQPPVVPPVVKVVPPVVVPPVAPPVVPPPPPVVQVPPPPPQPPPKPPAPPPAPPVQIPDHPLIKTLLQPGGGTATVPPGDIGPLMPKELMDGAGNIKIPGNANVSSLVRGIVDGEPPPSLSIDPKTNMLKITPAGKLTGFGAAVTQTSAKVSLSAFDGKIHAGGYIESFGAQKDLSGDLSKAVKAFNDRVDKAGLKVIDCKIDPKTGITITTAPK